MAGPQSIAARLRAFSILLVTIPLCVSVITFLLVIRGIVVDSSHRDIVVELKHHKFLAEDWLNYRLRDVFFFAQNRIQKTSDINMLQVGLRNFLTFHSSFDTVFFIPPEGSFVVGPYDKSSLDVADREYFKQAQQGIPTISNLLAGRYTRQPTVVFAAPLPFKNGKFQGLIIGSLGLQGINEILSHLRRTQNDQTYMATREGFLLTTRLINGQVVHPQYDNQGHATLKTTLPPANSLHKPTFYKNDAGNFVLGASQPLKNDEWVLVQERPLDEFLYGYGWILLMTIAGALISIALLTPFLIRLARRITLPLKSLTVMAEEITHGQYDNECPLLDTEDMPVEIKRLYENFCFMAERVSQQVTDLEYLSYCDTLTGMRNRRYLTREGPRLINLCERGNTPCSCLILDIDHFKNVNDTWGHDTGDIVLQNTARTLSSMLRASDIAIRMGGEEFAILAPHTDKEAAMTLAERIRSAIEQKKITAGENSLNITVSTGVALLAPNVTFGSTKLDDMLIKADKALYMAKSNGRNRCEQWAETTPPDT
ncbi:diguanylate cyclase [Oleidesulfovibrio sp.]|uniref:sensor domain-containing diguanylate cyclase n=1 Tax=Oleidesulfovibrio sp. TaxID=2909707 RepID=UPI003A8A1ADE